MKKAYSYIRFSTNQQLSGDSLRRQLDAAESYCKEQGLTLDSSLRDLGVSAFKGLNATEGALSRFFKLVESGEIAKGSTLIVESIDRLSRANVLDALSIFTGILKSGIKIVTLSDKREHTTQSVNANPMDLMASILVMARANEESQIKSIRSNANWDNIKRKAKQGLINKGKCPTYMEYKDGKFILSPKKAALIKKAIALTHEGWGAGLIAKEFNKDKSNWIARQNKPWQPSTVREILNSRILVGEKQYTKMVNGKRVNDGEPIKGYYPAILTEDEFYKLRGVIDSRQFYGNGTPGKVLANLFGSLLIDGDDGSRMLINAHKTMISANHIKGLNKEKRQSFNYDIFERCFLKFCSQINLTKSAKQDNVLILQGKLEAIMGKLELFKDQELTTTLIGIIGKLDKEAEQLKQEIEIERAKQTQVVSDPRAIGIAANQIKPGISSEELLAIRQQLKGAIATCLDSCKVFIRATNVWNRQLTAQIRFKDGTCKLLLIKVSGIKREVEILVVDNIDEASMMLFIKQSLKELGWKAD